jgi:hypothetical protein
LYIYLYVRTLFGPPQLPHTLCSASVQKVFWPLILWFCWRENIKDNKRNTAFLLVWDKDSCTERFLVLFPWVCVLQPILVHLYQTSSLLPDIQREFVIGHTTPQIYHLLKWELQSFLFVFRKHWNRTEWWPWVVLLQIHSALFGIVEFLELRTKVSLL